MNKLTRKLLAMGFVLGMGLPAVQAQTNRPNVLLIAVDDLNDWIGCMGGHPQAKTPHIDRLAARGVLFDNAHCQSPVCNPSRASMMTSLYPATTGIYFLNPDLSQSPVARENILMPKRFEREGYHVTGAGKIFHGNQNKKYLPNYGGSFGGFGPIPKKKISPFPGMKLWDWGAFPENDELMPDHKIAAWGVEQLQQTRDKPLFLATGFYRPHVPQYAPQKWFDLYPLDSLRLPKVLENDLEDLSAYGINLTRLKHVAPTHKWVLENDEWKPLVRSYLACVSFVDHQIGKVLDALDASPHKDNTFIVLYTDHGFHLGEKERWAKRSLWEDGTRVPMIIAGPGVAKGKVCKKPVQLLDVYPTLLELTGLAADEKLEGHSMVPLLKNPEADWPHLARTSFGPGNVSICSERYRYIHYNDGSEEFYDHAEDPHEWHNLIGNQEKKTLIEEHRAALPETYHAILGTNSTGHKAFQASEAERPDAQQGRRDTPTVKTYDIAAFYWPSLHYDERWAAFFPGGGKEGEWESIRNCKPKWEGHWQPRVPEWGYVMDNDPKAMEKKIDAATTHGVNVMIFDWYWFENKQFLESALNDGFLKARNVDKMKFYLMWANHDANTTWDIRRSHKMETIWPGSVDLPTFKTVVARVISKYFSHPSYYKIDGEPVFSIYDMNNLIKGLGGIRQTVAALDYFRAEVKKAGFPGLHFQMIYWGRVPKIDDSGFASAKGTAANTIKTFKVDSLTNYQFVHLSRPQGDYIKWADKALSNWPKWSKQFDVPYFPHVSIGWDNNARFVAKRGAVTQNVNPQTFRKYLQKARAYADAHPGQAKLITINAWNEWVEGSYLEPDKRFGMGYLEAVKDVFVTQQNATGVNPWDVPGQQHIGEAKKGMKWGLKAASSHEAGRWGLDKLVDGITASQSNSKGYSSDAASRADSPTWLEIDLREQKAIKTITLYPRTDTMAVNGMTAGFPVDLTVSLRKRGGAYTVAKKLTDIPNPQGKPFEIDLATGTAFPEAEAIKIEVTKRGLPPANERAAYRFQLAELEVEFAE